MVAAVSREHRFRNAGVNCEGWKVDRSGGTRRVRLAGVLVALAAWLASTATGQPSRTPGSPVAPAHD